MHIPTICFLFLMSMLLRAQDSTQSVDYVLNPRWDLKHRFTATLGSTITFVPRPIAEEEIRQIPMIDANLRWNLSSGFALTGRIGSNYVTNLVSLGGQWSTNWGDFSFAVGDEASYWYGMANMDEFDVSAIGWLNSPRISIGMATPEFMLTLRAELLFVTARSTRVGDLEIASDQNQRAGGSLALYIEQPFVGHTHVLLGLKVNNLRNAYQSWLAFATFSDPLIYPELTMGVIL